MTSLLDDVLDRLKSLPEDERQSVVETACEQTKNMRFVPLPGPQTEAYLSKADILLYGGEAGGGKTGLLVGLAQEHKHSIIFRRESSQTDGLERFGKEVYGTKGFNGSDLEWNWGDSSLKLAGMKEPGDWAKNAGRERDFMGFDEAGEFLRVQIGSIRGWCRGPAGQRARVVLASNPPRSSDGYWMTEWFAPWLDMHHPQRADPGELRWAVLLEGASGQYPFWVDGPDLLEIDGEMRHPLSFSFIPASLEDNPFRNTVEYRAFLDSLPEPLRSQLKKGDWAAGMEDRANQAIPTEWVRLAMERWKPQAPVGIPMCAIGVDVAQGGGDQSTLAPRYDGWYAPLVAVPGAQTPGGADVAGLVIAKRHGDAKVIVDVGGGWGGDAVKHLAANIGAENVLAYMGVKVSQRRTKDNLLRYKNVRTQAIWQFREALDPTQEGGSPIQLPSDPELLADLTAATFRTVSERGGMAIAAESKEDVVKRLGRSTDKGDAVIMAWFSGAKAVTDLAEWRKRDVGLPRGRVPQVIMGRAAAQRARGKR